MPRTNIQPMRRVRNIWHPTTFEQAQAYEVRLGGANGKALARFATLERAKTFAKLIDSQRRNRTREQMLGCRYSEVREEVAARNATTIARSLTPTEHAALLAKRSAEG